MSLYYSYFIVIVIFCSLVKQNFKVHPIIKIHHVCCPKTCLSKKSSHKKFRYKDSKTYIFVAKDQPTMLALRQSIITRPISITGALRTSIQRPLTSSIFRATSSFHTKSLLYNTSKSTDQLNWNEFLALRIKRRRVNVISSGITAILGVGAGWAFISNIEIDPTQMIFGFDPLAVYSIGL